MRWRLGTRSRHGALGRGLVAILGAASFLTALFTPLLGNLYSLVADVGYFIPRESSVLTFRVLADNPGSGEWWIRGQDRHNFYAIDDKEPIYYIIPKRALHACPTFSPMDLATWCPSITVKAQISHGAGRR